MTEHQRRYIRQSMVVGLLMTALASLTATFGVLDGLERWAFDRRAIYCQFFSSEPSQELVHLDIDDATLSAVQRWPWPREVIADVIDEIALAEPAQIGVDLLLSEPAPPTYVPSIGGGMHAMDGDQLLTDAIERAGNVVLAMDFQVRPTLDDSEVDGQALMAEHLEWSFEAFVQEMQAKGHRLPSGRLWMDQYIESRRRAMHARLRPLMDDGVTDLDTLRSRLLVDTDDLTTGSAVLRLLEQTRRELLAVNRSTSWPTDVTDAAAPTIGQPTLVNTVLSPPLPALVDAAAGVGFVTYKPEEDGQMRVTPLVVASDGRMYPQFGLVLAAKALGLKLETTTVDRHTLTIEREGGGLFRVPVHARPVASVEGADAAEAAGLAYVPWFGPTDWTQMYRRSTEPAAETPQHLPLVRVWSVRDRLRRIRVNNTTADRAIAMILAGSMDPMQPSAFALDPYLARQYVEQQLDPNDAEGRAEGITLAMSQLLGSGRLAEYASIPDADLDEEEATYRDGIRMAARVLDKVYQHNQKLKAEVETQRAELKRLLKDRIVLIGWTATGGSASSTDFVSTSIHARCPGVVVHGVIVNGLLHGDFWRDAPAWVSVVATFLIGLIATVIAAMLPPTRALPAVLLVSVLYLIFNGVVLFDYFNYLVDVAAPMTAVLLIGSLVTVQRFLVERFERQRVTQSFSVYVDPALVNYVLENPNGARFDGQVREMTVMFTDLDGFTQLTEQLGAATVGVLNDYMGAMVKVIREHRGYVNKFLGDGIMCFFNAPQDNANHASDAIACALAMQRRLISFNAGLIRQGLPSVAMRAGITTGEMIVGDAGSDDFSDYTVLGDMVNLAARLESANKATGTHLLLNDRTATLAGDAYLFAPIGDIQVVGRARPVAAYTAFCRQIEADDQQTMMAGMLGQLAAAIREHRHADCLAMVEQYEEAFGELKLMELYRRHCESADPANPRGVIVLASK